MSWKHQQRTLILDELRAQKTITKKRAVELCSKYYERNPAKYIGEILSRMVNSGRLERVKRGTYRLKPKTQPANQLNLF